MEQAPKIYTQMRKALIIAEVGSVHDGGFGNALMLADLTRNRGVAVLQNGTFF